MTLSSTHRCSRKRWNSSVPIAYAAIAFRTDKPFLPFSAVVSTCLWSHSVELDPKVSQTICPFDHSSTKHDVLLHRFACCTVVNSAPHGCAFGLTRDLVSWHKLCSCCCTALAASWFSLNALDEPIICWCE